MAASESVTTLVDELIALFNQRSLDLPDGYFTRHTQFRLNGVAFEAMLGRSDQDPLVLMITRGAAGYRFTAKAIQYAVPDVQLVRGALHQCSDGDTEIVTGQCWLSGHFRDTGEALELLADVELRLKGATLANANATADPALIERLQQARQSR
jgi:hypothetical protein